VDSVFYKEIVDRDKSVSLSIVVSSRFK